MVSMFNGHFSGNLPILDGKNYDKITKSCTQRSQEERLQRFVHHPSMHGSWIFLKELLMLYLPRKHWISWKEHMQTRTMWRWGRTLTRDGTSYFKGKGKLTRNREKNHYHDSYDRGNQVSW